MRGMTTTRQLRPTHHSRAGRPLLGYRADELIEGDVILDQLGQSVTVERVRVVADSIRHPHTTTGQWAVVSVRYADGTSGRQVVGPSLPLPLAAQPAVDGWCDNTAHGGHDHVERPSCVRFVSDADHTRQLLAEARKHDARVTYSPEAAYVARHRPY